MISEDYKPVGSRCTQVFVMVEILQGLWAVDLSKADGLDNEAYLLACDEGIVLIDTGYTTHDIDMFDAELGAMGRTWRDIRLILITHGHGDHVDNLAEIKRLTGAQVMAGEGDIPDVEAETGVKVDRGLRHGDYLHMCGVEVIHVPGHSPGNLAFFLSKQRAIIVGDTIFGDDLGNLYPPPEKYCLDVAMAASEIKRLLFYDFDALLLSHGRNLLKGAKRGVRMLCEEVRLGT